MKIAIVRGHGLNNRRQNVYDPGAIGINGINEAAITENMASLVNIKLCADNIITFPIRLHDKNLVSLNKGIEIANEKKCDIYISFHCNASTDKNANGFEILVKQEGCLGDKLARCIYEKVKKWNSDKIKDRGIKYNLDQNNNVVFSRYDSETKKDKSVKLTELFMFKQASCIFEMGFITNQNDWSYLVDMKYLNVLARQVVDGIKDYIKLYCINKIAN